MTRSAETSPFEPHDFVVIYDLELTSWKGFRESNWTMPGKYLEVVQIGAIRVDLKDDFREVQDFVAYVKPTINPQLSEYFTALTGITQEKIETDGVSFATAIDRFTDFVGNAHAIASHGPDHKFLKLNCDLCHLASPGMLDRAINLRPWICERLGVVEGTYTSSELPGVVGINFDGAAHDALSDARALKEVVRHLQFGLR